MKNAWLYTLGLMLLAMVAFGASRAEAASLSSTSKFYYATPSWDQSLPADTRFIVLTNMSSLAILDLETGLVWEQSPSTSTFNWADAQNNCNILTTGGRLGWRLPTIQELASLVDPSVPPSPGPTLPAGHPFSNVQSAFYWSATTSAFDTTRAWFVDFEHGIVQNGFSKSGVIHVWCVRGGHGVDPQ